MAVSIGKRKRAGVAPSAIETSPNSSSGGSDTDVRARFQRAFEAKFKPLPENHLKITNDKASNDNLHSESDEDLEDSEDGFGGFSDEDENAVEVIEHGEVQISTDQETGRREMKAFMSNKPPSAIDALFAQAKRQTKSKDVTADDETESTNLKHDLNLQRLLKESHLLDPAVVNGTSPSSFAVQGKARLQALDLRMQDIGAKKSLSADVRMPMAHRKGILAKADSREVKRRREAIENGIILERPKSKSKSGGITSEKRRDIGIGAPSVGKFRGGTLRLSSKDVRSISGGGGGGPSRRGGKNRRN